MNKFKLFYLLLAAPLILSVSCSKDDPAPENNYKEPTIASRENIVAIPIGLENSQDPNAELAIMYLEMANDLAALGSSFAVPENAQIGTTKSSGTVYFWTAGGYSYWMTFTEHADKYTWKYEFEFSNVPRFTYIEAEELKTGKKGSWAIYYPDGTHTAMWNYNWTIDSVNDFSATMVMSGIQTFEFVVHDRADHSGDFKAYLSDEEFVRIIWNANGTGSWWYSLGVTYQGTW